ncbi:hypothetical protein ACLOJK_024431 [Asimina triloba]
MAKQLYEQSMQFESDHPSCMGGLVSLFDFRTGRPILRLISDMRQRSGGHAAGNGYPRTRRNLLANGSQKHEGTGSSTSTFSGYKDSKKNKVGSDKTSVKVLMDEEMSILQPSRKQTTRATNDEMGRKSRCEGHLRVNHRKTNKTYSMTSNQQPKNLGTSTQIDSHQSNHPELKGSFVVVDQPGRRKRQIREMHPNLKKKLNSSQTQNCSGQKPDPHHKLRSKVPQKHPITKKEPGEDTESFLNQKFINAKQHAKDGALHRSKECRDALEILNSNKELFLKLLEDPNSLLMKHIQDLRNAQLEKLSKTEDNGSLMQGDEIIGHEQNGRQSMSRFLGRKDKSSQLQIKNESRRIIILKPKNSTTIQSSMTLNRSSSSLQSHYTPNKQAENERFASHFSIREITRKLKHAVIESKKKRNSAVTDKTQRISNGPQDSTDTTIKLSKTEVSDEPPIRFYQREIEADIDEPQSSARYEDEISSSNDEENSNTVVYPHQKECNIYNEAKRYLSEMLNTGYGGEDLPSGQLPRTLGRIITTSDGTTFPLTNSSHEDDDEPSIASTSLHGSQFKSEDSSFFQKEESINCSSPSFHNVDKLVLSRVVGIPEIDSRFELQKENAHASKIQESICIRGTSSHKVGEEMIEIIDHLCMEESPMLEVPHEPETRTLIADRIHNDDVTEAAEHNASSEILPQHFSVNYTPDSNSHSSPLWNRWPLNMVLPKMHSTLCSRIARRDSPKEKAARTHLLIHKIEASETVCGKVERPSPVSVLEPGFTEDAISPSSPQDGELYDCQLTRDTATFYIGAELRFGPYREISAAKLPMEAQVMRFYQCDDLSSGTIGPEVKLKDPVEQQESKFEYVKTVLEASGLRHNETIELKHFPQQLLNPSLFNEIEASSAESSEEWRFLFDCINEVLKEVYEQCLSFCPRVSFVRPGVQRVPVGKVVVQEVQKGVERLLIPQFPKTIEEIIGKDMEKGRTWIDLCIHAEHISMEMEEIILEELIEETILDHCN